MNYVSSQPSGYDVTLRTYNVGGYKVDVTINGVTTTYAINEVRANPVDLGCAYLTYQAFGNMAYDVISKGTVEYNGNTILTCGEAILWSKLFARDT